MYSSAHLRTSSATWQKIIVQKYNFEKYNGEINCSHTSFLKRNDRYFFHKLAKRYNNRPEFQDFLVGNFAVEDSVNPK